jgi:hypothetical protein
VHSSVPVTTSPVVIPIRSSMPSAGKASRISTAARTALRTHGCPARAEPRGRN